MAARGLSKIQVLVEALKANALQLDATDEAQVAALFDALTSPSRAVVQNPSAGMRGPVEKLSADDVQNAIEVIAT
ncbi:MAG: hypothetical protein AAF943_12830 [Pseudomonadota bacterium]